MDRNKPLRLITLCAVKAVQGDPMVQNQSRSLNVVGNSAQKYNWKMCIHNLSGLETLELMFKAANNRYHGNSEAVSWNDKRKDKVLESQVKMLVSVGFTIGLHFYWLVLSKVTIFYNLSAHHVSVVAVYEKLLINSEFLQSHS